MNTQMQGDLAPVSVESLTVIRYQDRPVITTEVMALLYGTEVENIRKNFSRNNERFVEGKHYFKLEGAVLREFKNCVTDSHTVPKHTRVLILWTERGAARHAKMLDTNQAWDVFEKLEDAYFHAKTEAPAASVPAVKRDVGQLAWEACHELWPLLRNELAEHGAASVVVVIGDSGERTIRVLTADDTLISQGELNRIARVLLAAVPCALIPLAGETPYVDSIIRGIQGVLERH